MSRNLLCRQGRGLRRHLFAGLAALMSLQACAPADDEGALTPAGVAQDETEAEPVAEKQQALATGTRPLLVILSRRRSRPLAHNRAFYEERVFGTGPRSLVSYFKAASRNKLNFIKAGIVEVDDTASGTNTGERSRALNLARQVGFNFASFDKNGDRLVDPSELSVLLLTNSGGVGETAAEPCMAVGGGLFPTMACLVVAAASHTGGLMGSWAHEVGHMIGAQHLYKQGCMSERMTPMTCHNGDENDEQYAFDPHARSVLGWVSKELVVDAGTAGSARLAPLHKITATTGLPDGVYEQVRIRNKVSSLTENLLIENRQRGLIMDQNIPVTGPVFWWVRTNADGLFGEVTNLQGLENDAANFIVSPYNCRGDTEVVASRGTIDRETLPGTYRFKWRGGIDSGMIFTVSGQASDGSYVVSWKPSTEAPACLDQPGSLFTRSCVDATPVTTLTTGGSITSTNASYNDAQCKNAFVASARFISEGRTASATYAGPLPSPTFLGCNASWAQTAIWQWTAAGYKFQGAGPVAYGTQQGSTCLPAKSSVTLPSTGDYKVVGSAGLITTLQPVTLGLQ